VICGNDSREVISLAISEQVIDFAMNSCELDVVVVMLAISISQALIRLLAIIVIITASVNIAFIIRNTPAIIVKPIKLMECYFANIALTSLAIASIIADL